MSRVLIVSGVLAVMEFVAIPAGAALPGSVFSELVSGLWLVSLVAVALAIHRLIGARAGSISLLALIIGLASMTVELAFILAIITGRASPLDNTQLSILAYAVMGLWLIVVSRLLIALEVLPAKIAWIGGATGLSYIASWILVQLGGFPTSADPSSLASLSPATIVGSVLSMLSAPAYAVWAIWAGRRLGRERATAGVVAGTHA